MKAAWWFIPQLVFIEAVIFGVCEGLFRLACWRLRRRERRRVLKRQG